MKFTKRDWKEFLIDILTIREFAKEFWGDEIAIPEDFGMSILEWEYHLGRIVTSKDPVKEIKKYYNGSIHRQSNKRNGKNK